MASKKKVDVQDGRGGNKGAQTMARGLRALRLIGDSIDGMSAQELAAALPAGTSSTYRMLRTLEEHGFVRRDSDARYRLGLLFMHLAEQTRYGIRSAALPVMKRLVEKIDASVMLIAADGPEAVVLAAVEPSTVAYRVRFMEGQRHPMNRGAAAYAIRAARPPRSDDPEPVLETRRRGYATSVGEVIPGAHGIAIALDSNRLGIEACLNVGARDPGRLAELVPALRATVEELSDVLSSGASPPGRTDLAPEADRGNGLYPDPASVLVGDVNLGGS